MIIKEKEKLFSQSPKIEVKFGWFGLVEKICIV